MQEKLPQTRPRDEYNRGNLSKQDLHSDPIHQLNQWLLDAVQNNEPELHAMTLATANHKAFPSARIVLLRDITHKGLSFYTNYNSRKGKDLQDNPRAAAVLFWPNLERQVRIEGIVTKHTPEVSDAYFQKRPYKTQLGAWASAQSEVIKNRNVLKHNMHKLEQTYPPPHVPRPPYWGGYLLTPSSMEFWQGRPHRLNDRLLYTQTNTQQWTLQRLAP